MNLDTQKNKTATDEVSLLNNSNYNKIKNFFNHYEDEVKIDCTFQGIDAVVTKVNLEIAEYLCNDEFKTNPVIRIDFATFNEKMDCDAVVARLSAIVIIQDLETFND